MSMNIDVASRLDLERALKSQAHHYRESLLDGPRGTYLGSYPPDSQIAMTIRQIRAGDAMIAATSYVASQLYDIKYESDALGHAMLGMAGRTLMYARPERIVSELGGIKAITDLTSYVRGDQRPLSDLMIENVMGANPVYPHVWEQLKDAGKAVGELENKQYFVRLVQDLGSIEDDNDMAVVCSRVSSKLLSDFRETEDESLAKAAYALAVCDSKIMGGDLTQHADLDSFIASEAKRQSLGMR